MNSTARKSKIYIEDTIQRTTDGTLGVVIRTWHDIEQPVDSLLLKPGEFEVNWLDAFGAYGERKLSEDEDISILHEDTASYHLLDRSFGLGDAVKQDSSSAMSGIVQNGQSRLTIRNLATREVRQCASGDVVVEAEKFQVGDYVVDSASEWVGIIKKLDRRTLVKFFGGELAFCDEFEMHPYQFEEGNIFYPDLLPGTTLVDLSKTGLKHAEYLTGKYTKGMSRSAVVCTSFTSRILVDWQFQNMMVPKYTPLPAPPIDYSFQVDTDLSQIPLRTAKLVDGFFTYQIGDVVRFKGETPYSKSFQEFINATLEDGKNACKDWEVVKTEQELTIKWQDGTSSSHTAVDLVPYLNVDDLDLWPSDHVISKSTGRCGIVQTCNAADRTASIQWDGCTHHEDESLYDLMNDGDFNVDLGDLVLIVPADGQISQQIGASQGWGPSAILSSISATVARCLSAVPRTMTAANELAKQKDLDWFGQLTSIEEDGTCVVSLCFQPEPQLVKVPVLRLVHVASTDADPEDDASDSQDDNSELEVDSTDSDSEAYSEDSDMHGVEADVPWQDEHGALVPVEDHDNEWEDDCDMSSSSDSDMLDVITEEIIEPSTTDIVLDVIPEPLSSAIEDVHAGQPSEASTLTTNPPKKKTGSSNSVVIKQGGSSPVKKVTVDRSTEVADAARPVRLSKDFFPVSETEFAAFAVLDTEPTDHAFAKEVLNRRTSAMKRIAQEYKTLSDSLPPGILVRAFESRMDLLRVVIFGPSGTPYEFAPMLFDLQIPPEYPQEPPVVHFHSWTNGVGKINPNLYEEGKVCLSLLGTWHGNDMSETWTTNSSLLQIFVSLQALVLVREPYYNEAGYEVLSVQDTAVASANYSERAFVLTRGFISHVLNNTVQGLEQEIRWLYLGPPRFLDLALAQAQSIVTVSEGVDSIKTDEFKDRCIAKVSKGALLLLKRTIAGLEKARDA